MILASLSDPAKAESLLNNLSEADFDINDVSVMMKDAELKNKIAGDVGPLRGIQPLQLSSALQAAGASSGQIKLCMDAVAQGKAVVAMKVDPKYEAAARRMFQDLAAELL